MLERTKTPHTDPVLLSFAVPPDRVGDVLRLMQQQGIVEHKESYAFRGEVFTGTNAELKASVLRGLRYREELTQAQLAEKTGIQRRHISAYENDKLPIGKAVAHRLAVALNADYRVFL